MVADSHVLMLCSPGSVDPVLGWISRNAAGGGADGMTGSGDVLKVSVADVSPKCVMLSLVGPESEAVLIELAGVRKGRREEG